MVPFSDYCRHRGFGRSRGAQLRKAGRFGDVLIEKSYGQTKRYFVTSFEAADKVLEQTAAGPRGQTRADVADAPAPRTRSKPTSTDKLDPRTMTKAESVRMKAAEDAMAAKVKRISAEMDLEIKRGEYILVPDAERQVDAWTARVVSMIAAIPSRVAQAGVPTAAVAIVRREINRMRKEIARDFDDEIAASEPTG